MTASASFFVLCFHVFDTAHGSSLMLTVNLTASVKTPLFRRRFFPIKSGVSGAFSSRNHSANAPFLHQKAPFSQRHIVVVALATSLPVGKWRTGIIPLHYDKATYSVFAYRIKERMG